MQGNQLIAYPPEHLNTFLEEYGVVADYIDPDFVYGYFDEVTGTWSGMMEHVGEEMITRNMYLNLFFTGCQ